MRRSEDCRLTTGLTGIAALPPISSLMDKVHLSVLACVGSSHSLLKFTLGADL